MPLLPLLVVLLLLLHTFFQQRQEQEVPHQESHRTWRSPKSVGADVQTSSGQSRDSQIPLILCS